MILREHEEYLPYNLLYILYNSVAAIFAFHKRDTNMAAAYKVL